MELVGNRIIGGDEPLPADRRLAATPGAFGGGGNGKAGWPRRG
ncbi:hypothetical protein X727_33500 [Mesorhizobium sp. L103C119B0]|nr:hypothetical protein X771_32805 [Mesorhizobium sp. LSJC277A00]ESW63120.1 hypothetical protein X773_33820 [Mesorhizobium sp. LSJC285A00]ESX09720.1 hypothetical protein X768_17015 [Mesorhizobium sp. LSJC265A00]ESX32962.1 hypothetical protein X765_08605 [Mesorhizobium sp. LSHC440B00]ESX43646.1 hypothetical protein X761_32950 [Mesorhizobium sp. LSHC424B00]ESX61948.1 hypothetical protein X758_33355 [Mesorhizobium sp. LSHC416B00]ESX67473.1 hypothetical protein X757_30475 [Mesorhizobium sp. LSHC4